MKKKLVIWGAGGHASVVADALRLQGQYDFVGFIDDMNPGRRGSFFCGAPVLGGREQLVVLIDKGIDQIIFGFGDGERRLLYSQTVLESGFSLARVIHPSAIIAQDVEIGQGTVILAGAIINTGASIGDNVIINTGAGVDHSCVIRHGAHICPGVHLAGSVIIGAATWIGIGATVIERISIGDHAFIGAGAVVTSNIPDRVLAYGVPARVVRRI